MRRKAAALGFGKAHRSNEAKNGMIKVHKKEVMKNAHYHRKTSTALKLKYSTKKDGSIGNFSGPNQRGFA